MSQPSKKSEVLVALDVGTTKVCTIIATLKDDQLEILGVGSHPSHGLKKGCVINIDKTVRSIRCSLEEAKLMSGLQEVSKATIGIAGSHIYSFNSSGAVAISRYLDCAARRPAPPPRNSGLRKSVSTSV